MFFQILGAIADFGHALMSERTMDGMAAAQARGHTGGQMPKLGPRQVALARQMYDELGDDDKRRYTVGEIAAEFGVPPADDPPHVGARGASGNSCVGRIGHDRPADLHRGNDGHR